MRDRVKQVYFEAGVAAPTDDQICVKLVQSGGTTPTGAEYTGANCGTAPAAPGTMASGSCAVLVWMTRPATIQLIVFPELDFDIGAQSVAYYGREAGSCTAS